MRRSDVMALMETIYSCKDSEIQALKIIGGFATRRGLTDRGEIDFIEKCLHYYYTCDQQIFDLYKSGLSVDEIHNRYKHTQAYNVHHQIIESAIISELEKLHQEAIRYDKLLDARKKREYDRLNRGIQKEMFEE